MSAIAASAWRACGRVADAHPPLHTYRRSWGCSNTRDILKSEILNLAMSVPGIRRTSTLSEMRSGLSRDVDVGESCPIPRKAALFLRKVSVSVVPTVNPPTIFRNTDLSACKPVSYHFARPVRLRDARQAPKLNADLETSRRLEDLDALDTAFRDAGFVRAWGESDVERRMRIVKAETWCTENDILKPIQTSVVLRAQANATMGLTDVKDISDAFKSMNLHPYTVPVWSDLTAAYRQALYSALQIKHLGFVPFILQYGTLRSFKPEVVATLATELVVHSANKAEMFDQMRDITLASRHRVLVDLSRAFTLEDANEVLARVCADIADGFIV